MAPSAVPPQGIWVPAVTLFDPSTDKLIPSEQKKYYAYLASTGLAGLVVLGTNAETFLLTREERKQLVVTAREAVGPDYPIMAGTGGHSTAQVLEYINDAHDAGANYALVLPPAYFGKASTNAVVKGFYDELAEKSPLPIVLYNFPAVCNGVDLDSDLIADLAKRHPGKITGVKLTCGATAKIVKLTAEFKPEQFAVFGGQSEFLISGLAVGSAGCIAAFANVFPKTVVKIYDLWKSGKTEQALELHRKAALAERPCKSGIGLTKYAAAVYTAPKAGLGSDAADKMAPRRPYTAPAEADRSKCKEIMGEVAKIEEGL